MKRLIINADDLGADEGRNTGIFEAIQAGMVTSASILPNGPALLDALERIRSGSFRNISWGIHLNLSEGKPVSTENTLLLAPQGVFGGKVPSHHLLMQEGNQALESEVAREIDAQITLLKTSGIPFSHLDGHQHAHLFPAVIKTTIGAAQKYNIPWVRISDEPVPTSPDFTSSSPLLEEANLFSRLGQTARPTVSASGLHSTDHFRGLYLKGRVTIQELKSVMQSLPDGLTELMVHPGRTINHSMETPFSGFSTVEREQELETLLNANLRFILEEKRITLTSFPESPY